ncbi:hypothetical protein B0A53_05470 [Rhodotorula sp. CCFEE 5036]|jgi:large subunit ribosomal protein L10|nr:hypothetical protein B0A53_05470 [Rhodotorula sp. CCFEE 5036]
MPRPTVRVQAAAAGARRTFPAAKALAFREQAHLLTHNDLVLFLRPGDFAAHEWRTIRQQIAAVPPPPASSEGSIPTTAEGNQLRLTYLRPGLVPAIVRTLQQQRTQGTAVPDTSLLADASHSSGPLAALTAPTLHPPTLLRVLTLLQTFSRTPPPNAPPPPPPVKGKDAPPIVVERLKLLSSLLDQTTAADPDQTTKIANLPPIEVLQAQIVGLLSAPGARITGVVSARASELARTLEGFKLGLEEAAAPSSSESPSA